MNSNYIKCPYCKWSIDITHHKLKEGAILYCYNCNTYFNYITNSYITIVEKDVSRGTHDKNKY